VPIELSCINARLRVAAITKDFLDTLMPLPYFVPGRGVLGSGQTASACFVELLAPG
jgi:hypothetical protein